MTLDGLARGVGLSVTFLSRLERGQVACSIGNLLEIAGYLDLSPAALFEDAEPGDSTSDFRVVRGRAREAENGTGQDWHQLASGRAEQRLEAFCLELSDAAAAPPLVTHPGEEFCYVLEGDVEFRVGDEVISLGTGDSIHLRSDVPHMAWRAGRGPARLLMVTAIENLSATAVEWWAQTSVARGRAISPASSGKQQSSSKEYGK